MKVAFEICQIWNNEICKFLSRKSVQVILYNLRKSVKSYRVVLENNFAGVPSASVAVVRNALSEFELPIPRFPLYITFEWVKTEPNPIRVEFRQTG